MMIAEMREVPEDEPAKSIFGPTDNGNNSWTFSIHSPKAKSVRLTFSNDRINWFSCNMEPVSEGLYQCTDRRIRPGARYWYVLDDEHGYPDPWSRCQPDGPQQASQLVDENAFYWNDRQWKGRPWHEAVIYELHVGTFTHEGTFLAAISRLHQLHDLGITALQIMPVWTSPAGISWGYDCNYLFSVNASYGSVDDFKSLIDAAHVLGIQVLLDVVYNHLGIEGNYLEKFNPCLLSAKGESLWGQKLDFDGTNSTAAREMIVANALFWLEQFHLDGLRIDSPVSIDDKSRTHILEELALAVQSRFNGRREIHLVLENDHYVGRLAGVEGKSLYQASLNIKASELLNTVAKTGNLTSDVGDIDQLVKSLAAGANFDFCNEWPKRTSFNDKLQADRQILCLQNHDLVGNRQTPSRIWQGLESSIGDLLLSIICLTPASPQFFMGDEIGCHQPFPFFCRFLDVSEAKILAGRQRDFNIAPDAEGFFNPFDEASIRAATISWPGGREVALAKNYKAIRNLLKTRRRYIHPLACKGRVAGATTSHAFDHQGVIWHYDHGWQLGFEWGRKLQDFTRETGKVIHELQSDHWVARWWVETQ